MFSFYSINDLIFEYGKWHYGRGLKELFEIAGNFLRFIAHFFSLPLILRTLFHPLQRIEETYKKGFDIGAFFSSFIVNSLMRVVGFGVRMVLVFFSLVAYILFIPIVCAAVLAWVLMPLILFLFLASSVSLIAKSV